MYATNKCNTCTLKRICKHYKYFRDNDDIEIEIKSCENYKTNMTFGELPTTSINRPVSMPTEINREPSRGISTTSHILADPINERTFVRKSDPYNPMTATYATSSISAIPVEISKVKCTRCQKEVSSIEAENCSECGRLVCSDCGVTTLNDSGMPEMTCEKCWSGTPDPDPNNPEEVSIVYGGDEKEEWDIEDFEKTTEDITEEVKEEEKTDEPKPKQVDNKRPAKKSKK